MLSDNEDLYFQVYSDYVRKSYNATSPISGLTVATKSRSKTVRKPKKHSLKTIAEEESNKSALSNIEENSETSSEPSPVKKDANALVPALPNFIIPSSVNERISSVRKDMYMLSQYISSKEKVATAHREEEMESKGERILNSDSEHSDYDSDSDSDCQHGQSDSSSDTEHIIHTRPMRKRKI